MSREWVPVRGVPQWGVMGWEQCPPEVSVDTADWAHGVWTAVAVTLAEPLRQALGEHYEGCVFCQDRGIAHCPTGALLWRLLPDGDRVVIA